MTLHLRETKLSLGDAKGAPAFVRRIAWIPVNTRLELLLFYAVILGVSLNFPGYIQNDQHAVGNNPLQSILPMAVESTEVPKRLVLQVATNSSANATFRTLLMSTWQLEELVWVHPQNSSCILLSTSYCPEGWTTSEYLRIIINFSCTA